MKTHTCLTGAFLATLAASLTSVVSAATVTWIGGAGSFTDPLNWDDGVPTSTDIAVVNNGGTAEFTTGSHAFTGANYLDVSSGTFSQSGGTFTANASNNAANTVRFGTGTGTGSLLVSGGTFNSLYLRFGVDTGSTGLATISNGGIVNMSGNSAWIVIGFNGSGNVTVDGTGSQLNRSGTGAGQGIMLGDFANSSGTLTVSNGASVTNSGILRLGNSEGSSGILNITGGATVTTAATGTNASSIGGNATGDGTIRGSGVLTVDGTGSALTSAGRLFFADGRNATSIGNTITNGGAITVNNDWLIIGRGGDATISVSGGSLTKNGASNGITVGDHHTAGTYKGTGTVTVDNGGSFSSSTFLHVGRDGATGTVNVNTSGTTNVTGDLVVGIRSNNSATYDGSKGTLNIAGGSVTAANVILAGSTNPITITPNEITSELHVSNGGSITAQNITAGSGTNTTVTATFNNAIIVAAANEASFFNGFSATDLTIGSGGLTFNTQGNDVELVVGLSGVGGLTKTGSGSLSLHEFDNTFTGNVVVENGTLVIKGADSIADSATLALDAGTTLNLDFAGTEVVGAFSVNGLLATAGIYDAAELNTLFGGDATFLGTGSLQVVPEPSTYALLGGLAVLGLVALRRRRA